MNDQYLLYIDILGFTELVRDDPDRVELIYSVIDSLNINSHSMFSTIAFSDTILVYSSKEPCTQKDHEYNVLYLIEVASDLQVRLCRHNVYFRAILVYGQFKHYKLNNIECFYGGALIDAYFAEKKLDCIGLLIDKHCSCVNKIFKTVYYDESYDFVYLHQNIEMLQSTTAGIIPVDILILSNCPDILYEVNHLKGIYHEMRNNADPKIRSKHAVAFDLYRICYNQILSALELNDFDPCVLNSQYDWGKQLLAFNESCKN